MKETYPISWQPHITKAVADTDVIRIQQVGSGDVMHATVEELQAADRDRLKDLEDRLVLLDDAGTGEVTLLKSAVGDESEGLVKTVADNTAALADVMKPYTPVPATTKANLKLNGSTNYVTFEAKVAGLVGNDISITVKGDGGVSHALEFGVIGSAITITLKTNGDSVPISTIAEIATAVTNTEDPSYNAAVAALITASSHGTGTTVMGDSTITNLAGGDDDGTTAAKGATMFDDDFIYLAIDDCDGSADMTTWKKVALSVFAAE